MTGGDFSNGTIAVARIGWIVALGIAALTWIGSIAVYPQLPDRLPIHWNIHGEPDGYGDKAVAAFLMPGIMLGLLVLLRVLPWLSPKAYQVDSFPGVVAYITVTITAMLAYLHAMTLWAGWGGGVDVGRAVVGGVLGGMIALGVVMAKVKRNFYIGVRTPWTLANEQVWNETHRLAAWSMSSTSAIGLVLVLSGAPLPIAIGLLLVGALGPVLFSFLRYKQLERAGAI